jgi:Uma2 family endonuclease
MRASVTRAAGGPKLETVKGSDFVLAIEVALTSLPFDPGLKSRLYAEYGFQVFWVVDAQKRQNFVHRKSSKSKGTELFERGPEDALTQTALPGFSLKLADV